MKKKQSNSEIYEPLAIYFRRDNPMQMDAFRFLSLIGRNKTTLITKLINQYLKNNGVQSVIKLSKEQANSLISDANTFSQKSQQVSSVFENQDLDLLATLLQGLLSKQNNISMNQPTVQPHATLQSADQSQEKTNRGRFGSKDNNIVQEQPISSSTVPEERSIPNQEPGELIMEEPEEDYPDSEEENSNATLMPTWAKGLDMFKL